MTEHEQHGRRVRRLAAGAAALLVLAGLTAVVVGLATQVHPPQPAAAFGVPVSATSSGAEGSGVTPSPSTGETPAPGAVPPLPASLPVHVDIPAIGVSSDLLRLGQNPDGTVEVPPLTRDSKAGWYRYSSTPGQLGPAVLLGHVDSARYGPGVFFRLGALRPGDTVAVTRADRTVATFRVTRVARFAKNEFPTLEVYGNTDDAELRLITCGGAFDSAASSYLDDIVVFAVLTGASS